MMLMYQKRRGRAGRPALREAMACTSQRRVKSTEPP